MNKKVATSLGLLLILVSLSGCSLFKKKEQAQETTSRKKIEAPVNQIPVSERPFVTLKPISGRNKLDLTIYTLPKQADSVEIVLEYDRNEGVLDAVLKEVDIAQLPQTVELFLGSKSAGGHITYHDDVIGGDLTLNFFGDEDYALKVPWRYADTETSYEEFSTADGRFQVVMSDAYQTSKILAMQSPGAPDGLSDEVIAGPYLLLGVGALPDTQATVSLRLAEANENVTVMGWDGSDWSELEASIEGRSVSVNDQLFQVYTVVEN